MFLLSYREYADLQEMKEKYCFPTNQHIFFYVVRTAHARREEFFPFLFRVKPHIAVKDNPYHVISAYLCEKDYEFLYRCAENIGLKATRGRIRGIIAYYAMFFALKGYNHAGGG